jgi:hypothetical protein
MAHGAVDNADGIHADALMPAPHHSRRNRTSGQWESLILTCAHALVIGVLCGELTLLPTTSALLHPALQGAFFADVIYLPRTDAAPAPPLAYIFV